MRVAIVGPTGCGKTTLINLLMRFYDVNSGEILIDGVETRSMPRHELRKKFGMVLQETWLRNATVAENIAMAKAAGSGKRNHRRRKGLSRARVHNASSERLRHRT